MKCSNCSHDLKWVVAVDVDGTMAQYHSHYASFVESYDDRLPLTLPRRWNGFGEFRDVLGLTQREHHERKLAFRAGGFKRWMPRFNYADLMVQTLKAMGIEVWVTTTRPWMRMDNVDTDTVEWLRRHDIPFDHLLFDEDKYHRLTELVDPERILAILDDEFEQRRRCEELGLPFVLARTEWNYEVAGAGIDDLRNFLPIVYERIGMRDALQH